MYRILVPVDADTDRAQRQAEFVADLPIPEADVEVIITHALPPEDISAEDDVHAIGNVETVQLARDYLEERDYTVELAEGRLPPADAILDMVRERDADQVVMGSRKRSPTGKVIFGSVSQQVLLESPVPVTIVGAEAT